MEGPATDERLAAIKQEGRRRRTVRHRRHATIAGVAALFALVGPLALQNKSGDRSQEKAYAAKAACHNAADPACGPARWDPQPAPNRPATARLAKAGADVEGTAGQPLELSVVWDDPDGPQLAATTACWGDSPCPEPQPPCTNPNAYGNWTPPTPKPGSGTVRPGHTYERPGSYQVTMTLHTAAWNRQGCVPKPLGDPYASEANIATTVLVR